MRKCIGMRRTLHKSALVVFGVLLSLGAAVYAGSLSPSGPVASTMHSLAEIYDSIVGTFDSSSVVANQNGNLTEQLKYIEANVGGPSVWASGSNNIWNLNSGNVGIGTTNPTTKLELVGIASISDDLYASASWFRWGTDTSPASAIKLGVLSNAQSIPLYEIRAFDNAANSASFDIHSNRWAEDFRISRAGSTGDRLGLRFLYQADCCGAASPTLDLYNSSTGATSVKTRLNQQGDSFFVGGNVGIGTTTPGAPLEVFNGLKITTTFAGGHDQYTYGAPYYRGPYFNMYRAQGTPTAPAAATAARGSRAPPASRSRR